jgi:hypothetical protein
MATFSFEEGIVTAVFSTDCALRIRVSISAIGSLCSYCESPESDYQLALTTPGMSPLEGQVADLAAGQSELAERARGRPVSPQRLRWRVG